MSSASAPADDRSVLLRLMAAVRSEFRTEVLIPPVGDPIMGAPPCRVAECGGPSEAHRLCAGHYARWREAGRPDLDRFCVEMPAGTAGREPPGACRVAGCYFGWSEAGLCATHASRWRWAGKPCVDDWLQAGGHERPGRTPRPCAVAECRVWAAPRGVGLCRGHQARWHKAGRPDVDRFAAGETARERAEGLRPPGSCACEGCEFGAKGHGLCPRHHEGWRRAGCPPIARWLATQAAAPPPSQCAVPSCRLWACRRTATLCRSHRTLWTRHGCPPVEQFIVVCESRSDERFDFCPLDGQLRLEVQYAVQCRVDRRQSRVRPRDINAVIRVLAQSEASSLLERSSAQWAQAFTSMYRGNTSGRAFLRFARERVEDLHQGEGWENEYPRDVWYFRRLGISGRGGETRLRLDRIEQSWLRELVKRWLRWRLASGRSASLVIINLRGMTHLSRFLADHAGIEGIAELDGQVLERFLAWFHSQGHSDDYLNSGATSIQMFLRALRQHGWALDLPTTAVLYPEDYPPKPPLPARAVPESVMAQLESADNLARFADPESKVMTLIMIRAGLRIGDLCRLAFDCIVRDRDGAAYLRYVNHKMRREAFVPLDEELAVLIGEQQQRVRRRWPEAPLLFARPTSNPDGTRPMPTGTYRYRMYAWLRTCDIRDDAGDPLKLTPHQWRHTFGTRLINLDVPQEVVRKLLDHDSHEMTAHYARLSDTTVRRHWEQARKVNIAGDPVTIDADGPLSDAAWMRENLGRAKQALPNGYCGLPLQQTCPHANACLTCPVFVTTAEFLPQHHQQRENTLKLIAVAESDGHARMVEMNQQVLASLDRIITALDAPDVDSSPDACDAS